MFGLDTVFSNRSMPSLFHVLTLLNVILLPSLQRLAPNICKHIHLPAQSGNSEILAKMRRGYTREAYLELVHRIREFIPRITLSTDLILGFCGETEEQYQDTISLVQQVRYNNAFVYAYSMREVRLLFIL